MYTMSIDVPHNLKAPLMQLLLSIADDKLLLGTRNSDWTGLGPILEEDIAFSHLAQDEIAHAQAFYELAAELSSRKADDIAMGRPPREFRSAAIVEVPDEFDWATALARKLFCDHFDLLRLERMAKSEWKPLRDLASRIADEERVHVVHTDNWVMRLGRGGTEARQRMQKAIDALAPIAATLFEPFDGLKSLVDAKIYPGSDFTMYDDWLRQITSVLDQAGLHANIVVGEPDDKGGRRGVHTEHLKPLLDEMCEVYRSDPGAAW
jgi:ring-1,2-phenylacetyl-CoA epoxidase subunit PaaC